MPTHPWGIIGLNRDNVFFTVEAQLGAIDSPTVVCINFSTQQKI